MSKGGRNDSAMLGVDIGGTGIKAAVVDVEAMRLLTDRVRVPTPQPSTPERVAGVVAELVDTLGWEGLVGIGLPALIRGEVVVRGNNLDPSWQGVRAVEFFEEALGSPVAVANDADLAGLAEVRYVPGLREVRKLLFLTLGTGVGSAFFYYGQLIPEFEIGSMRYKKGILEEYISNAARKSKGMSWEQYGRKLSRALRYLYDIFTPDAFVLGGGLSKKFELFEPHFSWREVPITPARLLNNAGIIGAALYAHQNIGDVDG